MGSLKKGKQMATLAPPQELLVFVYGTLKRGFYNHGWLAHARLLGMGRIHGVMHDLGAYPGLEIPEGIMDMEEDNHVTGEVYAADALTLGSLDQLEGCPHLYTRRKVKLCAAGGTGEEVWTYVATPATLARASRGIIKSGIWQAAQPRKDRRKAART